MSSKPQIYYKFHKILRSVSKVYSKCSLLGCLLSADSEEVPLNLCKIVLYSAD